MKNYVLVKKERSGSVELLELFFCSLISGATIQDKENNLACWLKENLSKNYNSVEELDYNHAVCAFKCNDTVFFIDSVKLHENYIS